MSEFTRLAGAAAAALLLAACQIAPRVAETPPPAAPKAVTEASFERLPWTALPATADADWLALWPAFERGCAALARQPAWAGVCTEVRALPPGATPATGAQARAWFAQRFEPWRVRALTRTEGQPDTLSDTGLATGYFEPELRGSRTRSARYATPLHRTPDDLLVVELDSVYPQLSGMRLRGRLEGNKVRPYPARGEIARGALPESAVLLWVDDPLDAFFLQVQGSGRVVLEDGGTVRVGYAEQNGRPYAAIGRWLVAQGELKLEEVSMQSIQDWARRHPHRINELLDQNPSYVFFRELPLGDAAAGPVGALGVALTPGRSVAIDPRQLPLGAPVLIATTQTLDGKALTRPWMAQDTGGAIRGPLRFDLFWGFGPEAAALAGKQRAEASAWVLVPRGAEPAALLKR